ncbi:hypothetical protein L596_017230 [Steinernema carpocapsae]|uniref:BTB domain-containing protein n=1 Tax=Steinernema carpocapsae TaxID=34508 RepID=A0A4U5N176_STECR|nr:hypothetical protein L596_017230 [Steinernema carpocapsae]
MFDSNTYLEAQTGVCMLPDVKRQDFLVLLHMAYGLPVDYSAIIKYSDLSSVIRLADRLQFDGMLTEIENFLITLSQKEILRWEMVAEQFRFKKLREVILAIIKRIDQK